ncbi:DUF5060 domain-containing protein [Maribacter halichondriae]|uniref:DUF5060 domain-containing protein n=1 Tax=Maribacter halichondriae TaxID=2980554 RepID=UPI002359DCD4|nr:DUF5060 domain-containing protein [Maribacter sp. Hal144]
MQLPIKKVRFLLCLVVLSFTIGGCKTEIADQNYVLEGSLKKWQPVTITFDGPKVSETDSINPFLHYGLWVNFKNGENQYSVPGYFAADGHTADTGAESGNKWQVKFSLIQKEFGNSRPISPKGPI